MLSILIIDNHVESKNDTKVTQNNIYLYLYIFNLFVHKNISAHIVIHQRSAHNMVSRRVSSSEIFKTVRLREASSLT